MPDVVFVAGRDPRSEPGGGHSSYVRAHARAALRAGYTPHLVCVGATPEISETDYGVIHRAFSPARPFRQLLIAVHGPILARAAANLAAARAVRVLHGFGVWGWAAVSARERMGTRGISARALVSSYTTYADESRSRVEALSGVHSQGERLRYRAEDAFSRLAVLPFERRAYRGADLHLNFFTSRSAGSSWRIRERPRCRRIAYTSEHAFRGEDAPPSGEPAFLEALEPPSAPLVVSVSRHEPRKGLDVLLNALARLKARGVPFRACLAGEGPLLETHRDLADRLGLGASTLIAGFVPDVSSLLSRANIFVLPSHREQSGSLALIEVLQAGLAAVASGCDGIRGRDGRRGRSSRDWAIPEALEAALLRLLGDADLRRRLGARARETFLRRFSAEAFARDLGAVYREEAAVLST